MQALKLTVIGSGDAFGSGGRRNTCFAVESSKINFLIDCGANTLQGLKENHINPSDINLILISHFHGDHFGGLPYFLLDASVNRGEKPLTIISPKNCKDKIIQLLNLLYPTTEVLNKIIITFIEFHSYETIKTEFLEVKAFPVIHSEATDPHGLRIKVENRTISYSGDTEWTESLIEISEQTDLFICECCFYKSKVNGHLNYQLLKTKMKYFNCKNILLTHFDSEMLNNIKQVDIPCAYDGMIIYI